MMSNRRLRDHWGKLLRQARIDAGYSQKAFAGEFGVAQEIISRWENGVYAPSDENRHRLAKTLGKPVHELFPYSILDEPNGEEVA